MIFTARVINKVDFDSAPPKAVRVAAYARVSTGTDEMKHSLAAQGDYYRKLIKEHPGWVFAGIYADEAVSGTKESRCEFDRLVADCESECIDMIITKSISRFARNTVVLLDTVRRLKNCGVSVFFEEQNINTDSAGGELMLTLLASFAQEEARSVSENQKWRIRQCFAEGRPWNMNMLGYRQESGKLIVVPEEAEIVRRIYSEYLSGKGPGRIMKGLNADGIPAPRGGEWETSTIRKILKNRAYTGELELQRYYTESHLSPYTVENNGVLQKYKVEDSHEPIISKETFEAVQTEITKRAEKYRKETERKTYPYSQKIVCGVCGKSYRRTINHSKPVWVCITYSFKGKKQCQSKQISEAVLDDLLKDTDMNSVRQITVFNNNVIVVEFCGGEVKQLEWKVPSRADSWTPEMKEAAHKRTKERMMRNAESNRHTSDAE